MASNEPGQPELTPSLPKRDFISLEKRLISLSDKMADPNSREVKEIHKIREPLISAARKTDAYHDMKTHFVHLQEEIKDGKDSYDGVIRRIHEFNADGADLAILAETGNDNLGGFAEVYKGMTILKMQEAHADAMADRTKDANWKRQAEDLARQIKIKGWEQEDFGSQDISDIAKKTVEERVVQATKKLDEDEEFENSIFNRPNYEASTVTLSSTQTITPLDDEAGVETGDNILEPDFLEFPIKVDGLVEGKDPAITDKGLVAIAREIDNDNPSVDQLKQMRDNLDAWYLREIRKTTDGELPPELETQEILLSNLINEELERLSPLEDTQKITPQERTQVEREVFGEGDAFTERWVKKVHGIKDVIQPAYGSGVTEPFSPVDILNEVLETGLTQQQQLIQVTETFKSSPDRNFRIAALNGFIGLINVNNQMKTGRIEYVAEALKGLPPQAIAQWLTVDSETKRSLQALFELEGYKIANPIGIDKTGEPPFSDFVNLKHDQITEYLGRVQRAVGTDRGVVTLAYTIFRSLGFPHENAKFAKDLVGKYQYNPETKKGDIDASDIGPFIDRFEDPTAKIRGKKPLPGKEKYYLRDVLEKEGMDQFIVSLNNLQAQQVAREWDDMKLILDAMDNISDIRDGVGGASMMSRDDRYKSILGMKELAVAMAKRKFSDSTVKRILDATKISQAPGAATPSQMDKEKKVLREIFGFIPRPKPKSVKGK